MTLDAATRAIRAWREAPTTLTAGAPKSNPQLEAGLKAAVFNNDGTALNTYGDELVKAGYSEQQVLALIKKYQGEK